ncbi:GntR family transcriptional regulator [Rhodococcus sp. 14C212]|uniref:FCD domain-containing protein n=1 Tax=Rhodococcus sp. 14C212 TaxID=2711209 RepID=UPI0013EBCCC5|nr:GntR family transcriptional regulator [Rhodococcus sp. 14C212]
MATAKTAGAAKDNRPETLVSFIERRIETAIAEGEYGSGARLSPSALAKEFEVSHIPVREALSSLAAKGFIDYRQARGFFTRDLSFDELDDIYTWRTVLETEALRLAMPKITEDDIAEMRGILEEESHKLSAADRLEYLELNRRFHFVAFNRVGSPVLLHLLGYLWDITKPYTAAELIESTQGHEDHLRQLELFEARDIDGMIAAMDAHRGYRRNMQRDREARMDEPAPAKKARARKPAARKSTAGK